MCKINPANLRPSGATQRAKVGRKQYPEDVGQPLREAEVDELVSELEAYATEVFGEAEAARHWLDTNLWELDNLSPRQIVARAGRSGFNRARDVLLRIEYGVYS